jgi:hypothetical protein
MHDASNGITAIEIQWLYHETAILTLLAIMAKWSQGFPF